MHKRVGMVAFILFIVALIIAPGAVDKLFALFFVGIVPYTTYTIPPAAMLVIYAFLLALGMYGIARQLATVTSPVKREIEARDRARKKILHTKRQTTASTHHSKKHFLAATEQQTQ